MKFQTSGSPNQHFNINKTQKHRTPLQNRKEKEGKKQPFLSSEKQNKTQQQKGKTRSEIKWLLTFKIFIFFPFFPFFLGKIVGYFWENWQ